MWSHPNSSEAAKKRRKKCYQNAWQRKAEIPARYTNVQSTVYIQLAIILPTSAFCPHSVCVCFVRIWKFTQGIPLSCLLDGEAADRALGWLRVFCRVSGRMTVGRDIQPKWRHRAWSVMPHNGWLSGCTHFLVNHRSIRATPAQPDGTNNRHCITRLIDRPVPHHNTVCILYKGGHGQCALQATSYTDTYRVVVDF